MILSRLTHALREQNWLAVGIEFIIVEAGVVIGFQISAWNEARQTRTSRIGAPVSLVSAAILRDPNVLPRRA